jgi:hypothetical protein
MRVARYVLAAVLTGALVIPASATADAPSPSAPPLYRLEASKARSIGEKLVRRAVRRSPRLDGAAFRECIRTLRGMECLFVGYGLTAEAEFVCRFKVQVRGRHGHPHGRIVARTCQKTLRPLLTSARAREAITLVAEERIGSDSLIELHRVARSAFVAYAAWPADADGPPVCVLKLTAELLPSEAVLVRPRGVTCAA